MQDRLKSYISQLLLNLSLVQEQTPKNCLYFFPLFYFSCFSEPGCKSSNSELFHELFFSHSILGGRQLSQVQFFLFYRQPQQQQQIQSLMVVKSKICFVHEEKLLILNASVPNTPESSGSFIIALGIYLSSAVNLYPQSVITQHEMEDTITKGKVRHPRLRPCEDYLQIWCDFLFELASKDAMVVVADQAVFISQISESYNELIKKTGRFTQHNLRSADVKLFLRQNIYNSHENQSTGNTRKKIAIINFSLSVTETDKTLPKINLDCLFTGVFYRKGDLWSSFKIVKGEIPSPEEIIAYDTIILTGSSYSVNNMHQNIGIFAANVLQALNMKKQLKVVASCFGHQLISHALGIKVQKRKQMRNLQTLSINADLMSHVPYLSQISKISSSTMRVYEYHSDYVTDVPQGFKCVASSSGCQNEMFVSENQRVVTFQFHPQYSVEYIRWMERRWDGGQITRVVGKEAVDEEHHNSLKIVRNSIRQLMDL